MQQRELALMRQYERVLVQRETEALEEALAAGNARSESLARAGRMLRAVMRRLGGEDRGAYEAHLAQAHGARGRDASSASSVPRQPSVAEMGDGSDRADGEEEGADGEAGQARREGVEEEEEVDVDRALEEDDDPEKRLAVAEWALERECELARLEHEHEELLRLAEGLLKPPAPTVLQTRTAGEPAASASERAEEGSDEHSSFSQPQHQQGRLLGGSAGSVGPFGTYKKSTGRMG